VFRLRYHPGQRRENPVAADLARADRRRRSARPRASHRPHEGSERAPGGRDGRRAGWDGAGDHHWRGPDRWPDPDPEWRRTGWTQRGGLHPAFTAVRRRRGPEHEPARTAEIEGSASMAFIGESTFPGINQGTGLVPTAQPPVQPPQSTPGVDVAASGAPAEASAPSGANGASSGASDTAATGLAGSGNVSAYSWLLAWGV